jgi:hypothetical protein
MDLVMGVSTIPPWILFQGQYTLASILTDGAS